MSIDPLHRAAEHCFLAGVGDVGMALCQANAPYGVAKIHHVQRALGVPEDATFVGAPDATITRNNRRWSQGFSYGGMYSWTGDFAVLDIKPNACGMSVGALESLPALDDVRARLHELDTRTLELDGVPLDNDLTESNHFVDVFRVSDDSGYEAAPGGAKYLYIMHSSGHEHRDQSPRGPGLYWDESAELLAMARTFETPWGSLRVLEGARAHEWYTFYRKVQDFNHRRRQVLAEHLFGAHEVIINATHQGMVRGFNRANIGCYTFAGPDSDSDGGGPDSDGDSGAHVTDKHGGPEDRPDLLFPLTLSPILPAFLVRPRANIQADAFDGLGWSERVARHRLESRLTNINILPHGGGYNYPQLAGVARVLDDTPDGRRFELIPANPGDAMQIIETPRDLRYAYRGMEVKQRMEELELGRAVVKLDLEYILTA